MDKLGLVSAVLFVVADAFAIMALSMPDWIITAVPGKLNHFYSVTLYNDYLFT